MSANKPSGLGRGLDTLISSEFDASLLMDAGERIQNIPISEVSPNPEQPRKHFDEQGLQELRDSVKAHGILQPLIVSPVKSGYIIVAGERRWRAAGLAKLKTVPAIVRDRKEHEQLEVALIENVQRVDLSPLETAMTIEKLHQQFGFSYTDIAKKLAKAETTVSNIVRLLQLPADAREALRQGKISEGHARAILSLKDDPSRQAQLLAAIIAGGWSVRQAEQFVSAAKQGAKSKAEVNRRMATTTPETEHLAKRLGTPVSIKHTARGGRLEIHFKSDDELGGLLKKLG